MKILTITALSSVVALAGAHYAQAGSCGSCGDGKKAEVTEKVCGTKACAATDKKVCGTKDCDATAKKACGTKGCAITAEKAHGYKVVEIEAVEKAVGAGAVVLDARGGKYLDDRRIPGAKVLPAGSTPEAIAKALPDKDARIVAYCTNTGCPASAVLAKQLVELGYTNVEKYPGGIDAWEAAGKKVEKVEQQ